MTRSPTRLVVALAAALLLGQAVPAGANDDAAAALAAGVIGAAIGASLADHAHHHHKHKNQFSPKPGITCYDREAACYHDNGGFAGKMTWEVYR